MLHQDDADVNVQVVETRTIESRPSWRASLPTLEGEHVVLRELRISDAAALVSLVGAPEISRFISTPPTDVAAFESFIARCRAQRAAGTSACFAVTLAGQETAIGLFQVRELEPGFATAEWGFALGSAFWGSGLFAECAELVLEFAFSVIGVHRLEARAAARNGRGNRALLKVGAVQEGVLRQALFCGGTHVDQIIYGIIDEDWRASRGVLQTTRRVLVH